MQLLRFHLQSLLRAGASTVLLELAEPVSGASRPIKEQLDISINIDSAAPTRLNLWMNMCA